MKQYLQNGSLSRLRTTSGNLGKVSMWNNIGSQFACRCGIKSIFIIIVSIIPIICNHVLAKDEKGASRAEIVDVFLDQLLNGEALSNPQIEHYDISPDGKHVAFTIETIYSLEDISMRRGRNASPDVGIQTARRNDIWIAALDSGRLRQLTDSTHPSNRFYHPVWAPNGRGLAYYGVIDARAHLFICHDACQDNSECHEIKGIGIKAAQFRFNRPAWTREGKIIVPLAPEDEKSHEYLGENPLENIRKAHEKYVDPKGGSTASVVRSDDPSDLDQFVTSRYRVDLASYDPARSELEKLTTGMNVQRWKMSPDHQMLAYEVFNEIVPGTLEWNTDLYVLSLADKTHRCLSKRSKIGILWSPESRWLLRQGDGKLIALDAKNGASRTIVGEGGISLSGIYSHGDPLALSVGSYLWGPNGDGIIARNKEGWWFINSDGSNAKRLFENVGLTVKGVLRASGTGYAYSPDPFSIIISAGEAMSARNSLHIYDTRYGSIRQIMRGGISYSSLYDIGTRGDSTVVLYAIKEEEASNLWYGNVAAKRAIKLTNLNPRLKEVPRGRKLSIDYKSMKGEELRAALLLPTDYKSGMRYPLIAEVYGGTIVHSIEDEFPIYEYLDSKSVGSIPQLLSQCGYIIMRPSIPLSPEGQRGTPIKDITEAVLPAIDRAIEMKMADPERLGVIGHSYGGYTVNALITQTKRFRAAVSMAGMSNLVSNAGTFDSRRRYRSGGSAFMAGWSEGGQGRMGCSIWDDRYQWIENSPIFYLNRVDTPLLLIHGDLDFVPIQQAEEMFSGLKRLNKRVEFVRYFGEGHVINKQENIRDAWKRIVAWYDKYLRYK